MCQRGEALLSAIGPGYEQNRQYSFFGSFDCYVALIFCNFMFLYSDDIENHLSNEHGCNNANKFLNTNCISWLIVGHGKKKICLNSN